MSAHAEAIFPGDSPAALLEKPFEPDELLTRVRQVLGAGPGPANPDAAASHDHRMGASSSR